MHVPGQRGRAAIASDLGGRDRIGLIVSAEAAVFLWDRNSKQSGAMQIAVVFGREFGFAIVGRGAAGDYALSKLARARDNGGLRVVQAERRGIEDRPVQREFFRIDFSGQAWS